MNQYTRRENRRQRTEILKDVKKNGRVRPWRTKKLEAFSLANSLDRIAVKRNNMSKKRKAKRVRECGMPLTFIAPADANVFAPMRLYQPRFCGTRLCPTCNMRRSEKAFGQMSKVMNYIETHPEYKGYAYIFLTLTAMNVRGENLRAAFDDMTNAFQKMYHRKAYKDAVKGWFRSTEVTHNMTRNDYHHHLHIILAVDGNYFGAWENYITQDNWVRMWKSCMTVKYTPIVSVQKIKPKVNTEGEITMASSVSEITKYVVKSGDYVKIVELKDKYYENVWKDVDFDGNKTKVKELVLVEEPERIEMLQERMDEIVEILDEALYRRHLIGSGGVFKDVHQILELDDPETGDLANIDGESTPMREDLAYVLKTFRWRVGIGNYELAEVEPFDMIAYQEDMQSRMEKKREKLKSKIEKKKEKAKNKMTKG